VEGNLKGLTSQEQSEELTEDLVKSSAAKVGRDYTEVPLQEWYEREEGRVRRRKDRLLAKEALRRIASGQKAQPIESQTLTAKILEENVAHRTSRSIGPDTKYPRVIEQMQTLGLRSSRRLVEGNLGSSSVPAPTATAIGPASSVSAIKNTSDVPDEVSLPTMPKSGSINTWLMATPNPLPLSVRLPKEGAAITKDQPMGRYRRMLPLPAPTETDIGSIVSKITDKTSWTIPEDGTPVDIPVKRPKRGAIGRKDHLLIEYFEGLQNKANNGQVKPSVRVRVTPARRKGASGITIRNEDGTIRRVKLLGDGAPQDKCGEKVETRVAP
jgi:hypothetical protein